MPFAILPALLVAFSPPYAAPELLRLKPEVGSRLAFTMEFTIDLTSGAKGAHLDARMNLAERTMSVEGDRITLRRSTDPAKVTATGSEAKGMAETYRQSLKGTHTIVIDRRAKTVELVGGPGASTARTIDVILPDGPVSPGDTWEDAYGADQETKLRYTLCGIRNVGARRVALIDLTPGSEAGNGLRLEPGGMFALDLADGRWLRATAGARGKRGEIATAVHYEIARVGAPSWTTILAAFPKRD